MTDVFDDMQAPPREDVLAWATTLKLDAPLEAFFCHLAENLSLYHPHWDIQCSVCFCTRPAGSWMVPLPKKDGPRKVLCFHCGLNPESYYEAKIGALSLKYLKDTQAKANERVMTVFGKQALMAIQPYLMSPNARPFTPLPHLPPSMGPHKLGAFPTYFAPLPAGSGVSNAPAAAGPAPMEDEDDDERAVEERDTDLFELDRAEDESNAEYEAAMAAGIAAGVAAGMAALGAPGAGPEVVDLTADTDTETPVEPVEPPKNKKISRELKALARHTCPGAWIGKDEIKEILEEDPLHFVAHIPRTRSTRAPAGGSDKCTACGQIHKLV